MSETIFHRIIQREIPADIVYEDELAIAFKDINPVSPVHILIVPKQTVPSLDSAQVEDKLLLGHLLYTAAELARREGLDSNGYRIVINTGSNGGQTVFQLHLHLLGGRALDWPPG